MMHKGVFSSKTSISCCGLLLKTQRQFGPIEHFFAHIGVPRLLLISQ